MHCLARRRCQTEAPSPHRHSQFIIRVNCVCDLEMLPLFLKLGLCVCLFLRSSFTNENCQNGEYTVALERSFPAHCPAPPTPPEGPPPDGACGRTDGWQDGRSQGHPAQAVSDTRGKRGVRRRPAEESGALRFKCVCWRDTRGPDRRAPAPQQYSVGPECQLRALLGVERSSWRAVETHILSLCPEGRRGCLTQSRGGCIRPHVGDLAWRTE